MKISTIERKLMFYETSLEYLKTWVEENQELALQITRLLKEKSENISFTDLKKITQYHIEISKVMYASLALIDKIYRSKERIEKWHADLEKVQ